MSALAKKRRQALVYVTHRTDEIPEGFTRTLMLRDGSILAQGKIGAVLTDENASRCFGMDLQVLKIGRRFYTTPR